jgi:succinate dehydrogenase / fumarate reductase membrane anchor subunit
MANDKIGPKRLVVGAHYGLREWLAQRVTALVMIAYTVIVLISFLTGSNFSYEGWTGLFAQEWFKIATLVAFLALFYHAWLGMREVYLDWVPATGLRFGMYVLTIVWLVGCAVWTARILWRA